nr:hypothetical protein BaRGS_002661 [Batillaria attramentaria]
MPKQPGHLHLATLDEHFEEVTQYILDNHLTRNYWVDAVRDDPLQTSGASFEWVSLGASNDLFGFSLTVSEGYDWAKAACEKEAGDVRLATLATMFQEVTQYISQNYNDREFWVDATRPDTDQVFHWADGTAVNDSMWTADGIYRRDHHANRLTDPSIYRRDHHANRLTDRSIYRRDHHANRLTDRSIYGRYHDPNRLTDRNTLLYSGNVSMAALLEEVKRKMKSAQDNLLLDKANLSATIRAKTSAKDSRPSAQATGALGIVMLSIRVISKTGHREKG